MAVKSIYDPTLYDPRGTPETWFQERYGMSYQDYAKKYGSPDADNAMEQIHIGWRQQRGPYRQPYLETDWGLTKAEAREVMAARERIHEPVPPITITTPEGKSVDINQRDLNILSNLTGKPLFEKQIDLGIIPKGSIYVSEKEYLPTSSVAQIRKESPDLYQVLTGQGYESYLSAVKKQQKGYELKTKEYEVKKASFERANLQLKDGTWFPVADWNELPEKYQSIGIRQGGTAMIEAINQDRKAQDKALNRIEPYKTADGYDLLAAVRDGVKREELKLLGFPDKAIDQVFDSKKAATETKVALPGEKTWLDVRTNEIISDADYKRLTRGGISAEADYYVRAPAEARRMGVVALSFVFPPAKALLPEVKLSDITPLEWGLGAANIALLSAPYLAAPLKGVGALAVTKAGIPITGSTFAYKAGVTGIRLAAGGVYTAQTIQNWNDYSPVEKAISAVIDATIVGSALVGSIGLAKFSKVPKQARFNFDFSREAATITKSPELGAALKDISEAFAKRDIKLLRVGARNLEIAAAEAPKELLPESTRNLLQTRARLLLKEAENYIGLTKESPRDIKPIKQGLSVNERFAKQAIEQLKKVKNPKRRLAIEEAIKEAQRQVGVATKIRTPLRKVIMPEEAGKMLPTKITGKAVARVKEALKKSNKVILAGKKEVKLSEFAGEYEPKTIANKHGITESQLIWAVSKLPVTERQLILTVHPEIIPAMPPKSVPAQLIGTELLSEIKPISVPKEETKAAPEEKAAEELAPGPAPIPKPVTEPSITPKPAPKPTRTVEESMTTLVVSPSLTTRTDIGNTDTQKRAFLKTKAGVVARRRGQLNGKDVWHINFYPYGPKDRTILLGKPPAGAKRVTGPGSLAKSAILLRGKPPMRPILIDTGAVDDIIYPSENGIIVISVRDTTITPPKKAIIERNRFRITAKRPRLRK